MSYKVGIVASCFDLLHAGHCLYLKDAKDHCDFLVAALQVDPSLEREGKNKPILSFEERRILLESNKYVDHIIDYKTEEDLLKILKSYDNHIRILGNDYLNKDFTGQELGNEVYYHDRKSHGLSTTNIRKRILEAENE